MPNLRCQTEAYISSMWLSIWARGWRRDVRHLYFFDADEGVVWRFLSVKVCLGWFQIMTLIWSYWYTVYYHVSFLKTLWSSIGIAYSRAYWGWTKSSLTRWNVVNTCHFNSCDIYHYRLACLDFLHLRISEDVVLKVEKRDMCRTQIPAAVLALMHCSFMRCLDETFWTFPIPSMQSKKKQTGFQLPFVWRKRIFFAIQTGWWACSATVSC